MVAINYTKLYCQLFQFSGIESHGLVLVSYLSLPVAATNVSATYCTFHIQLIEIEETLLSYYECELLNIFSPQTFGSNVTWKGLL